MQLSTKDYILKKIIENKPNGEDYPYPEIPNFPKSTENLLEEFKRNLTAGAATYHHISDEKEAEELIKKIYPTAKIICSAAPEIKGNKDILKVIDPHELNDVDVGVIRAEFGIANSGMVWMTENDMHITSLGFLSQNLVILLKPDNLVRDCYEAYGRLTFQDSNYGTFMLGPSATADIGAVMVRGAQGARTLTVFFM